MHVSGPHCYPACRYRAHSAGSGRLRMDRFSSCRPTAVPGRAGLQSWDGPGTRAPATNGHSRDRGPKQVSQSAPCWGPGVPGPSPGEQRAETAHGLRDCVAGNKIRMKERRNVCRGARDKSQPRRRMTRSKQVFYQPQPLHEGVQEDSPG